MGKAKRGATDLNGILIVDKPSGMTSHDVVDRLRQITGEGRIGHAGTLDPAARGLLILCIGRATRYSDVMMAGDKTYEARIVFGVETDTDDAEGVAIAEAALPECLADREFAESLLFGFIGEQLQIPPCYSAIKQQGRKAYELARAGKEVVLQSRAVTIHSIRLIEAAEEHWDIEAHVSKGTYLRSLARDIGQAAGTRAHLGGLCRTKSGQFSLSDAYSLEELGHSDIRALLLDPVRDLGMALTKTKEG